MTSAAPAGIRGGLGASRWTGRRVAVGARVLIARAEPPRAPTTASLDELTTLLRRWHERFPRGAWEAKRDDAACKTAPGDGPALCPGRRRVGGGRGSHARRLAGRARGHVPWQRRQCVRAVRPGHMWRAGGTSVGRLTERAASTPGRGHGRSRAPTWTGRGCAGPIIEPVASRQLERVRGLHGPAPHRVPGRGLTAAERAVVPAPCHGGLFLNAGYLSGAPSSTRFSPELTIDCLAPGPPGRTIWRRGRVTPCRRASHVRLINTARNLPPRGEVVS